MKTKRTDEKITCLITFCVIYDNELYTSAVISTNISKKLYTKYDY